LEFYYILSFFSSRPSKIIDLIKMINIINIFFKETLTNFGHKNRNNPFLKKSPIKLDSKNVSISKLFLYLCLILLPHRDPI
jgi:hypothetical protein